MKAVCIGVHVHAEPARLLATLDSLRAHTSQEIDVLLLPDGPDRVTQAALSKLAHFPQSGTAKPLGPPACFNRLASSTSADVLVLLESGALVGPGWLDYLLAALAASPINGLAGPSTNLAWNEQCVFPRAGGTPADIKRTAQQAAQQFGASMRTLEPLYSLGDFCYAVRREVVLAIGEADERYGLGPCWEMDYNIRAARAGFQGVWACGAYVYRAPFTARRRREEALRFEASKHLYQDKFCRLRLLSEKTGYEPNCRGGACEHFAPADLIQVTLQRGESKQQESAGSKQYIPTLSQDTTIRDDKPLVSCIMPTRDRRAYVRQALVYFERQQYTNRELIILDDGEDKVADLVPPEDPRIRYIALPGRISIGEKRNLACQLARGSIIAHWDDDDWYAPHRLEHQIAPLLARQADMTALETSCFFDLATREAWACSPDLHRRLFVGDVHGGTLVYWRRVWESGARYPDASLAEDARFLQLARRRGARLQKLPHDHSFVYLRHDGNAWRFPLGSYLDPRGWQKVNIHDYIPAEDLAFYHDLFPQAMTAPASAQPSASVSGRAIPQAGTPASARDVVMPHTALQWNPQGDATPLVSCIMPTYNRPRYMQQSIKYFLRQDYPNCELIILDDSPQRADDLIPSDPRIRYTHLDARMILGAKRNLACRLARGSIIVHWDDDDWIAPQRLSVQVELLERQRADLCSTYRQLYYDSDNNRAWFYQYPRSARRLPLGNTLCYRKSLWERNPFPEIAVGEDTRFVWSRQVRNIAFLDDSSFYVGLIHSGNTSRKILIGACWHALPVEEVHRLLASDLDFYRHPK